MAIDNFIPEIWSAKIFQDYEKAFVFGSLVNRDYEGEIRNRGDTVKINHVGPITVNSHTKNSTSVTLQPLMGADMTLTIDYADDFGFFLDDIDKAQQDPKIMATAMRNAGYALANTADARIGALYTEAGQTMTTQAVGPTAIAGKLAEIHRLLDDQNVPYEGRWIAVPPWLHANALLGLMGYSPSTNSGLKNVQADAMAGRVGQLMGFDIFMTNNLTETANSASTGREHYVLAGTRDAITFADQISSVEAFRPESMFADAVKGLHVYGMKVIQPKALVACPFAESTV